MDTLWKTMFEESRSKQVIRTYQRREEAIVDDEDIGTLGKNGSM
jgi:hypothetical protein